jgi:hypothetical protein
LSHSEGSRYLTRVQQQEVNVAGRIAEGPGRTGLILIAAVLLLSGSPAASGYAVVDTGQQTFYDDSTEIVAPLPSEPFYGQDAEYEGPEPSYVDNGDGTVTDLLTGLMWQKTPGEKATYDDAVANAGTFELAGHDDWRLPTIKELYSLIDFGGIDPSGWTGGDPSELTPFIDTEYFDFEYGDADAGERIIDAQYWSSTEYVGETMGGDATTFGVNFADGRIKGYPSEPVGPPGQQFTMTAFVRHVRGGDGYGLNDFVDNGDGTITDLATGLMWMQEDSGTGYDWEGALAYAEGLTFAGHDDWRLPNAKELQSIVDYTRSPQTTSSPAIDPILDCTAIVDEGGGVNYPFYWTGTTHINWTETEGAWGAYVAFGEALGWMQPPGGGSYELLDVHGAGAQRSDPKSGDPADWPYGNGPQGDVVRIYNYVRCVRGGVETGVDDSEGPSPIGSIRFSPNPFRDRTEVTLLLPAGAESASCVIYDVNGRVVRSLRAAEAPGDEIRFVWDGTSDAGGRVAAGTYFAELRTPSAAERIRLVLLR